MELDQGKYFRPLKKVNDYEGKMNNPFEVALVNPICERAVKEVQNYLENQSWDHNFGLDPKQDGMVIGKMFGVLIVKTEHDELGYLVAFSGKCAKTNHLDFFVPPVFDMLIDGNFFEKEEKVINALNDEIFQLEKSVSDFQNEIKALKAIRKSKSHQLQQRLFESYKFLNKRGESKSLLSIFEDVGGGKPPAGAGECAGPKLLQTAFKNNWEPLYITEFWWGASPKAQLREHKAFYPACEEKCRPILTYMLDGLCSSMK